MVTEHLLLPFDFLVIPIYFFPCALSRPPSEIPAHQTSLTEFPIVTPYRDPRLGKFDQNPVHTWPPNYPSFTHIPGTDTHPLPLTSLPSIPRHFPER